MIETRLTLPPAQSSGEARPRALHPRIALTGEAAALRRFAGVHREALDLSRALGGLGVCRAHSGTILGVLLDPRRTGPDEALRGGRRRLSEAVTVRLQGLVDGGAR